MRTPWRLHSKPCLPEFCLLLAKHPTFLQGHLSEWGLDSLCPLRARLRMHFGLSLFPQSSLAVIESSSQHTAAQTTSAPVLMALSKVTLQMSLERPAPQFLHLYNSNPANTSWCCHGDCKRNSRCAVRWRCSIPVTAVIIIYLLLAWTPGELLY